MRRRLLAFPGQGSQKANIGKALAEAFPRSAGRVFKQADERLDGLFQQVAWNTSLDPKQVEAQLSLTRNTQPFVLATSVAVLETLKAEKALVVNESSVGCLVGHSLGEFTCLVAANALEFEDALMLVTKRGEFMQEAATKWGRKPMMSAVLGLEWESAKEIERNCPKEFVVQAACANGLEQSVLAGCEEGVTWATEQAVTKHGARKGLKVKVSCPFHTRVMLPAADKFADALKTVKIREPIVPVIFGIDGQPRRDPFDIKDALIKGMSSPVLWASAVRQAGALFGPLDFQEIGGDTLRFGVKNVNGITVSKPIRAAPEDVGSFS